MPVLEDLQAALDAAEAAVAANTTVDGSAATLLDQLMAVYTDALSAGGTPQEVVDRVTALTNMLAASTTSLQAALVRNTPQAPPAEPPTAPTV